ncbi:MAG: hypothetical protein KAH32_01875 [Chlamydiia bacterium]|nr:hypothetical protein [Chlamydiia bacterium]
MMNNISKNIRSLISRNGKIQGANISIIVGSALMVVCIAIKIALYSGIIQKFKNILRNILKRETGKEGDVSNKDNLTLNDSFNIASSQEQNSFPVKNKRFIKIMKLISNSKNGTSAADLDNEGVVKYRVPGAKLDSLDSFTFEIGDQDFEVFHGDTSESKEILSNEVRNSHSEVNNIGLLSLSNIFITEKMVLEDTQSKDMLLVRKLPDIKTSNKIKRTSVLNSRDKCTNAAESLVNLAGSLLFIPPSDLKNYRSLATKFNALKQDFYYDGKLNKTTDYDFTASKILGRNFFTYSQDSKGEVSVEVLLGQSTGTGIMEDQPIREAAAMLLCNYAIAITVFPNNVEDMIKNIHLSSQDKSFLRALAETTKNNMKKSEENRYVE